MNCATMSSWTVVLESVRGAVEMPGRRGGAVGGHDQERDDEEARVETARARPDQREETGHGDGVVHELRGTLGEPRHRADDLATEHEVDEGDPSGGAEDQRKDDDRVGAGSCDPFPLALDAREERE